MATAFVEPETLQSRHVNKSYSHLHYNKDYTMKFCGRRGGLMVSALET